MMMENIFKSIIGEQLSSVEFVQDYLQLHFDGNTLTFYSWPEINLGSKLYKVNDELYKNALCEMITHKVNRVVLLEKSKMELFFDNNNFITLSLVRNEANIGLVELVYFISIEKEWFILD